LRLKGVDHRIGDDTAEEEALCLLEEAAVCGALIFAGRAREFFVVHGGGRRVGRKGERDRRRRERNQNRQRLSCSIDAK